MKCTIMILTDVHDDDLLLCVQHAVSELRLVETSYYLRPCRAHEDHIKRFPYLIINKNGSKSCC